MGTYTFLSHTADIRMRVRGQTLTDLFRASFEGMVRYMTGSSKGYQKPSLPSKKIVIASDLESLLVNFLSDSLTTMHINKVKGKLIDLHIEKKFILTATIEWIPVKKFIKDIKAVTWHELSVRQVSDGIWEGNIIFDI